MNSHEIPLFKWRRYILIRDGLLVRGASAFVGAVRASTYRYDPDIRTQRKSA
jgi:hypothetical protein